MNNTAIRTTIRTVLAVIALATMAGCVPDPVPTPTPTPAVTISFAVGPAIVAPGCEVNCQRIVVDATGFSPSTPHAVQCRNNEGTYYSYVVTTDGEGASTSAVCFYGYGATNPTYVVFGGVESNRIYRPF